MMPPLQTERLHIVPTPLAVLQTRLETPAFTADVAINGVNHPVIFPEEWPGDALVLFPMLIQATENGLACVPWGGTAIERTERVAIGMLGCKGFPDEQGMVEIGYGFNPSHWNRGYATEAVRAFTAWLLAQPVVRCVTAECRVDNVGSLRVLEKSGFTRTGERTDPEDGPLLLWSRTNA